MTGFRYHYFDPITKSSNSCRYGTLLLSRYSGTFYEVSLLGDDDRILSQTIPFTVGLFRFKDDNGKIFSLSVNTFHLKCIA